MTRDEFVSAYLDEMTGLLLAAFRVAEPHRATDKPDAIAFATAGAFFIDQQRRSRALLGRMYDAIKTEKPANGHTQNGRQNKPVETKT